ncbi:hypothetical protein [Novosphingobium sp. AAP93]|uniref:hypothetical protein n=1 Tax=Novosphingobium sp. AAP93 TaxID=1523427 RepID=UPI000B01CF9F|nr:hypothetical protein [Novosphingobium sp. AAP93]
MNVNQTRGTPAERLGFIAFALKLLLLGLVVVALAMLGLDLAAGRKAGIPAVLLIAICSTAFAQIGCWVGYRVLTPRKPHKDRP